VSIRLYLICVLVRSNNPVLTLAAWRSQEQTRRFTTLVESANRTAGVEALKGVLAQSGVRSHERNTP
jgi:hypothetical protein